MMSGNQIFPDAPVVCSENGQFATVDHMEGSNVIKLKKDKHGQHHYIPLSWVTRVDGEVHIDRPGNQAMREWTSSPSIDPASDARGGTHKSKRQITEDRTSNEGRKNASSTDLKDRKTSKEQEPSLRNSGSPGHSGNKNPGNSIETL